MHSSTIERVIFIRPFSSAGVLKAPTSSIFKALLASPSEAFAITLFASSSRFNLKLPKPFSLSFMARSIINSISHSFKDFNSYISDLDNKAGIILKNGLYVVAPTRTILPSSISGNKTSC